MTQPLDQDYSEFLEEKKEDQETTLPVFGLTPDESVEDPKAHIKEVKFTKTPAFLWMMVTGGLVAFIVGLYGVTSYLSNARKAVAVAPAPEKDAFAEMSSPSPNDIVPRTPTDDTSTAIAEPTPKANGQKKSISSTERFTASQPAPSRVVYMNRPAASSSYSAPTRPTYSAPAQPLAPRQAVNVQPARVPAMHPAPKIAAVPEPVSAEPATVAEPLPEPIGALYAPSSGEGPQIESSAVASAPIPVQDSNKAVETAMVLYDSSSPAPVSNTATFTPPVQESKPAPVIAMAAPPAPLHNEGNQPLTAEEFAKKFPKKDEEQRLVASLAMIPTDSKLRGTTTKMVAWGSQESFPDSEEIRIQLNDNFKQDGKIVIPKGSVAVARPDKMGTKGQYVMANVTRIETPSGQTYTIEPGMLSASTKDGFIEAELKQPKHGGNNTGRVMSGIARNLAGLGVAAVVPNGDQFGDRVLQNVAATGLNSINGTEANNVSSNSQSPSIFVLKAKTPVSLIANGDIQLQ